MNAGTEVGGTPTGHIRFQLKSGTVGVELTTCPLRAAVDHHVLDEVIDNHTVRARSLVRIQRNEGELSHTVELPASEQPQPSLPPRDFAKCLYWKLHVIVNHDVGLSGATQDVLLALR